MGTLVSSLDYSQVAANLEGSCIIDLTSQVWDVESKEGLQGEVVLLTSRPAYSQVAGFLASVTYGFPFSIWINLTFPLPVVEREKGGRSGDIGFLPGQLTGCG